MSCQVVSGLCVSAGDLADRLCEQIRHWDHARDARPTITLHPAGTPDDKIGAGYVIDKPGARMVITY